MVPGGVLYSTDHLPHFNNLYVTSSNRPDPKMYNLISSVTWWRVVLGRTSKGKYMIYDQTFYFIKKI